MYVYLDECFLFVCTFVWIDDCLSLTVCLDERMMFVFVHLSG